MSLRIFTILWVLCKNIVVHTMKDPDNFYQYCKPSQITQYDSLCCRVAAIRLQAGRSVERASERPTDQTDRPTQRPTDSPTDRPSDRLFRNHFLRAYTCVGAPTCFLLKCIGEPMHVASANRYMEKLASADRCILHWPGGSSIAVALPPLRILTTRPIWRRQRALQIGDCP